MGNYLELERLLTDDEKLFCAIEQDRSARANGVTHDFTLFPFTEP